MVVEAAAGGVMYRSGGALPIQLVSLGKLARVRTLITWLHIPGHAAYPLNEVVDALARLVSVSVKDISNRPEDGVPCLAYAILSDGQGSMVMVDSRSLPLREGFPKADPGPPRQYCSCGGVRSASSLVARCWIDVSRGSAQDRAVHRITRHRLSVNSGSQSLTYLHCDRGDDLRALKEYGCDA
eukprot:90115-Pyramimonas_sp.AAC.2